jgi:hypothetical protein
MLENVARQFGFLNSAICSWRTHRLNVTSVQGKTEIVRVCAALLVPCPESCSRLAGNSAAFRAVRLAMTKYIANMKRHITAHHSNSPTQAYQFFLIAIP